MNFKIEAINLTKTFGSVTAVKNLNLKISPGEIFAFLGPNGAGKTTTIKIFSGLIKPTSGCAYVCGYDISKNSIEVKSRIGLVPDHPYIYPKLTGMEFLRLVGNVYRVKESDQKARISELTKMFDLEDVIDQLIETYSLGMRQKLVIASVLLHNPEVLLLDEPLVGLDPKSARILKDIFIQLARDGKSIFMCTHLLEIAEKLADRIGIINRGELIAIGTKDELQTFSGMKGSLEDVYLSLTGVINSTIN